MRPHRKDGYVHRTAVKVRIDEATLSQLDELCEALRMSRAHVVDVIVASALAEQRAWLKSVIRLRVESALESKRN